MAHPVSPMAIIGLGGRFPGKATDPLKLWDMCAEGEDAWTEIPSSRFNAKGFYHPDQSRSGAINVQGGFFLQEDMARFDAPFFSMTKAEAASLDPQQRLLLEGTYEALENAGIPMEQVSGSDMGVFVGSFCFDWAKMTLRDPDALPLYHPTGSGQAMLANRVSYFFNLHGPSLTLDTACSSSLVALHQACLSLRAGECSTAIVAGVNCLLCQDSLGSMNTMGFLSAAGRSYTFDSRASGYGRGEGVGVLVIRRLDAALQAGDAVRAVVRNTGVNQDGRTPGITFPSSTAQEALIRRVYAQVGLDLAETSYLEVHGTGTQAGDPIEASAIRDTFGAARGLRPGSSDSDGSDGSHNEKGPIVVGCIKTNIGHLEGAAGAAGIIKTVLMLEREAILPNADFQRPNEKIPLADWKLEVPTKLRSWRALAEADGIHVLRASVNGFGYGGTNGHVILESAADYMRMHVLPRASIAAISPTTSPFTPKRRRSSVSSASGTISNIAKGLRRWSRGHRWRPSLSSLGDSVTSDEFGSEHSHSDGESAPSSVPSPECSPKKTRKRVLSIDLDKDPFTTIEESLPDMKKASTIETTQEVAHLDVAEDKTVEAGESEEDEANQPEDASTEAEVDVPATKEVADLPRTETEAVSAQTGEPAVPEVVLEGMLEYMVVSLMDLEEVPEEESLVEPVMELEAIPAEPETTVTATNTELAVEQLVVPEEQAVSISESGKLPQEAMSTVQESAVEAEEADEEETKLQPEAAPEPTTPVSTVSFKFETPPDLALTPSTEGEPATAVMPEPVPRLFALTASDETTAKAQVAQLSAYLEEVEKSSESKASQTLFLDDLAYTLATRRSNLPWKAAVAASSIADLREKLGGLRYQQTSGSPLQLGKKGATRAAWVFTGQGAQWWAMGRELARTSATFRASLDRSAAILASSTLQADWSLEVELLGRTSPETSRVNEPAVSQPLCTVVQVALVDMLRAWGMRPTAVVGHSSGEIGAAYAAGLLSHEAAVAAAYFRVPLDSEAAQSCRGGMVAVACPESETLALLEGLERGGKAVIACYNSPQSFTLSGDDTAIEELVDVCKARGIRHRKLLIGFAYHSHRMAAAAEDYSRLLYANRTVLEAFGKPMEADGEEAIEMYTSVTGRKLEEGALTLDFWVENLVSPVRFTEALTQLCYGGDLTASKPAVDLLVEVGPHSALAGPMRQILMSESVLTNKIGVYGVLRRGQDATETAQALAVTLFSRGVHIDMEAANKDVRNSPANLEGGRTPQPSMLTDLPSYPWNHEAAYWAEPQENRRYRQRKHGRHDLLGAPVRFGIPLEPRWRQWIRTSEAPWVRDHRVQGLVVYPAAGYLCMAIEAVRQIHEDSGREIAGFEMRDVSLGVAMIVPDGSGEVEAHISLRPAIDSAQDSSTVWHEFFLYSCSDGNAEESMSRPMGAAVSETWSEHCRGQIAVRFKKAESGDGSDEQVTDMEAVRRERNRLDADARRETERLCTDVVNVESLYEHCTNIGLDYGPTFANLTSAKSGRSSIDGSRRIAGRVTLPDVEAIMPAHYHSPMVVHPGMLDACLHGVMAFGELIQEAIMPVYFGHIYVAAELEKVQAGEDVGVYLNIQRSGFRNINIDLNGWSPDGSSADPLIRMEGLRMTSLAGSMGDGENAQKPPKTYYEAAWKPDPALLTAAQLNGLCAHLMPSPEENHLLRRLDQSSFYMVDEALAQIPEARVATLSVKGHKLYKSLKRQRESVLRVQADEAATHPQGPEAVQRRPVDVNDIASWPNATAKERAAELADLEATALAEGPLLAAVTRSMHKIVLGEADPLEVTMKGDVLGRYYALNPRMARQYRQAAVYVDLLAHKNPEMRILEIGAGTGGATLPLLEALGRPDQPYSGVVPRFQSYDVTDISSGFFEAVREKTHVWQSRLHFRRLDIERQPVDQGFEAGTYDLVVAANVLHATRNISRTVTHARSLLRPGGVLLLIELVVVPEQRVATAAVANLFGIFDGWWVAEEDNRQDSPLLAEQQWDVILRDNGFSGLDVAVWETNDVATHQGSLMLSTAVAQAEIAEIQSKELESSSESGPARNLEDPSSTDSPTIMTDNAINIPWLNKLAHSVSSSSSIHTIDEDGFCIPSGPLIFYQTESGTLGQQTPESMERMRRLFVRPIDAPPADVLWLTRGTSTGENAPDFSLITGLLRTLRVELGGRLVHLDLEATTGTNEEASLDADIDTVSRVFTREFLQNLPGCSDLELAVRGGGVVHLPRYVEKLPIIDYVTSRTDRRQIVAAPAVQPGRNLKLEIGQPGQLDSLYFDDDERMDALELPHDHIEVDVRAAGLNFHDVMIAMGNIEDDSRLGIECAGIVTRVGSRVTSLKPGDRVAALADGTFATRVRFAAWRAQKVPAHLSLTAAAGLPIVLCTAVHSLRVAALTAGETVLIHSAAGGLGQALVQLCRQRGATVYATAGTAAKKQFLVDRCGVPADHIFSSRDEGFLEAIMQATDNRGVDVVFNVLAGELLHASWQCVAPFGRFIELGKRDLQRHARLDMEPFDRALTFAAVDLIALLNGRPDYSARLWAESMDLVRQGLARPASPVTPFALADAVSAFRTMQAGRHMGKLVLVPHLASAEAAQTTTTTTTTTDAFGVTTTVTTTTVTSTPADAHGAVASASASPTVLARVLSPRVPPIRLRPDAAYLLVGGLGGIGRALAARMVHDLGARYLIFLARGGVTSDVAAKAVADLRAAGAHIQVSNCDVGNAEQLAAVLREATANGFPPIRGAVHLGLVMESALFQHMASDAWNNSMWPKVAGTWNLHRLLPPDLDFFLLLSSMVGIMGNPSQAAYGAASAFQDAFARYRRRRGLAATTIDLGMITGIGYVAEHDDVLQNMRAHGFEEVEADECLALIESSFAPSHTKPGAVVDVVDANILSGLGLGRYSGGDLHQPIFLDPRFAQARHLAGAAAQGKSGDVSASALASASSPATQSIRARLREAASLPHVIGFLQDGLRSKIVSLLMLPSEEDLDPQKPLSQYGLDSLIAVELRNWVASEMEATVPVLEFLGSRTVQSLAGFIARQSRLLKKGLISE